MRIKMACRKQVIITFNNFGYYLSCKKIVPAKKSYRGIRIKVIKIICNFYEYAPEVPNFSGNFYI
jgi:hypothetical protein